MISREGKRFGDAREAIERGRYIRHHLVGFVVSVSVVVAAATAVDRGGDGGAGVMSAGATVLVCASVDSGYDLLRIGTVVGSNSGGFGGSRRAKGGRRLSDGLEIGTLGWMRKTGRVARVRLGVKLLNEIRTCLWQHQRRR